MGASKDAALPVRLFEISDVVLLSKKSDTGAVNCRRLAALQCGKTSGFEVILGLLNRVMESLGVPLGGECAWCACLQHPCHANHGSMPPWQVVCSCTAVLLRHQRAGYCTLLRLQHHIRSQNLGGAPSKESIYCHWLSSRVGFAGGLADLQGHATRKPKCSYEWQESHQPTFFRGRQAHILSDGHCVGCFGVVHPDVLRKFDISAPVSALELDLEPFCYDQDNQAIATHFVMQEL